MAPRDRNPRDTGDSDEDVYRDTGRHLTPVSGVETLDVEVSLLKKLVKQMQGEIRDLKEWRQKTEVDDAKKDAVLHGDGKVPGQLDRIEATLMRQTQMMENHAKEDEEMFRTADTRLSKVEGFSKEVKIRISTTVAVVSFLALALQAILGWAGVLPPH